MLKTRITHRISPGTYHLYGVGPGAGLVVILLFALATSASAQFMPFRLVSEDSVAVNPASFMAETGISVLDELNLLPTKLFAPYIPAQLTVSEETPVGFSDFYALLDLYAKRYGEDDNFTIRVVDNRTHTLLELFELESERESFLKTKEVDWKQIDRLRSNHTTDLVDKYEDRGIPRGAITAKWGRLNQIFEAREREEAYIEYELRLARRHGLSALATELGTVETFNQDDLVSRAGARGRYQMMPDVLRRHGIHTYRLNTTGGARRVVREELHPLLVMEPAFMVIRGYSNAVGHELPGLSAYHTGPFNIYKIYRLYLSHAKPNVEEESVVDAYLWALTDGYDIVSQSSSFKSASRAYLASAYGAFRAVEHMPLDFSGTIEAELVTLRPGTKLALSTLLTLIQKHAQDLDWGLEDSDHLYENFRQLNPHLPLEPADSDEVFVPKRSNIVLQYQNRRTPVRFFLPIGTSEAFAEAELNYFDTDQRRTFNADAFQDPVQSGEKTLLDWQYESLVENIGRFGFTEANRVLLNKLAEEMKKQAEADPTPYRKAQAEIIDIHSTLWRSVYWDRLAQDVRTYQTQRAQEARNESKP